MNAIVPRYAPKITRDEAIALLAASGCTDPIAVLGLRGYFEDSMGVRDANDIGIYDDAICVVTPTAYATFNANTDPSKLVTGRATLVPGVYWLELGIHNRSKAKEKQYPALIQASEMIVHRHGTEAFAEGLVSPAYGRCLGKGRWAGWFGINLHRGGEWETSSHGCQTIYKPQWPACIALAEREMERARIERIRYVLVNN